MIKAIFDTDAHGVSVECEISGKNRIDAEMNTCTEACVIVNTLYRTFIDRGYDFCAYAFKQMCLDGHVFKDLDEIKKVDAEPLAEPESEVNPRINELLKSIFGEDV